MVCCAEVTVGRPSQRRGASSAHRARLHVLRVEGPRPAAAASGTVGALGEGLWQWELVAVGVTDAVGDAGRALAACGRVQLALYACPRVVRVQLVVIGALGALRTKTRRGEKKDAVETRTLGNRRRGLTRWARAPPTTPDGRPLRLQSSGFSREFIHAGFESCGSAQQFGSLQCTSALGDIWIPPEVPNKATGSHGATGATWGMHTGLPVCMRPQTADPMCTYKPKHWGADQGHLQRHVPRDVGIEKRHPRRGFGHVASERLSDGSYTFGDLR